MPDLIELVLASRSVGRALLLKEAGLHATQIDPPFADPPEPTQHDVKTARQWAMELALAKARSAVTVLSKPENRNVIVIGADTIVVSPTGQWLGQPADIQAARAMLLSFRDADHDVVTGVALIHVHRDANGVHHDEETFSDAVSETFGHFTDKQLDDYLQSENWRGKAGSYNLYELQKRGWPILFSGDDTTIVGLPMQLLLSKLAKHGLVPTPNHTNIEQGSRDTSLASSLHRS